jgi:ethanolamine utilization protein EutQ (cupin superfamily)
MAKLISAPARMSAGGDKPIIIDEFIGRVNVLDARLSIVHMQNEGGWHEAGHTPDFDEYTVVLKGMLRVDHLDGVMDVVAGNAVLAHAGEWVQFSTPHPDGAEYIIVCLPALSPQMVWRDMQHAL